MVSDSGALLFGITLCADVGVVPGDKAWKVVSSGPNAKELVRISALIALTVAVARLVGEAGGGPAVLFNSESGCQGALVGIVWLIPIFGIYFSFELKTLRVWLGECRKGD